MNSCHVRTQSMQLNRHIVILLNTCVLCSKLSNKSDQNFCSSHVRNVSELSPQPFIFHDFPLDFPWLSVTQVWFQEFSGLKNVNFKFHGFPRLSKICTNLVKDSLKSEGITNLADVALSSKKGKKQMCWFSNSHTVIITASTQRSITGKSYQPFLPPSWPVEMLSSSEWHKTIFYMVLRKHNGWLHFLD